ncbi:MAG: CPBP family intramembrane metalloprotease [Actinomycetota bacterium]|nr:CPBP family intramembrane metalloprotease [Actinomycetota bacterium]
MNREADGTKAYLRMLSPKSGAIWRVVVAVVASLVGLVACAVLAVLLVTAVARLVGFDDFTVSLTNGVDAGDMLAINLGLALLIPLAWLLAWLLYGVHPRWLSSTRPGVRWRWLLTCVGVAAVVWSPFWVLGTAAAAITREAAIGAGVMAFVVIVLLTTPFQAAGEEYVFRGLLLKGFGATGLPVAVCCVLTGLLFATAHLQFDPPLFADRVLLGAAFAWLTVRTGGLEAGIAIHAVKNMAGLIPAGLLDDVDAALDPDSVTWIPFVVDAVLLAIAVPWIAYLWRRHEREVSPAPYSSAVPDPPTDRLS